MNYEDVYQDEFSFGAFKDPPGLSDPWSNVQEPVTYNEQHKPYQNIDATTSYSHNDTATSTLYLASVLPYGLLQEDLTSTTRAFLDEVEPEVASSAEYGETIAPLEIDSVQKTWRRLTTIKSKRVTFRGSAVQRETTTILRQWALQTKNQPFWNRPVSLQHNKKKVRESIGPAIFGWGRHDDNSTLVVKLPAEFPSQANDVNADAIDDFDDFVSAPAPVSNNVIHTISTVVPPMTVSATSLTNEQSSQVEQTRDPWGLAIFEEQQQRKSVETNVQPLRKQSATRKEMEDEATIARTTALLPDIEYLID